MQALGSQLTRSRGQPGSSVSAAWSIACVHHWADLDAGLDEARRVLKPGGRLVAIERLTQPGATGLASHGWTAEQASAFADRCRAHGFTGITTSQHRGGRRTMVSVTATAAAPGQGHSIQLAVRIEEGDRHLRALDVRVVAQARQCARAHAGGALRLGSGETRPRSG